MWLLSYLHVLFLHFLLGCSASAAAKGKIKPARKRDPPAGSLSLAWGLLGRAGRHWVTFGHAGSVLSDALVCPGAAWVMYRTLRWCWGDTGWWCSAALGARVMLRSLSGMLGRCWVRPGDTERKLRVLRDAGLCWDRLPAPPAGTHHVSLRAGSHPTAAPNQKAP